MHSVIRNTESKLNTRLTEIRRNYNRILLAAGKQRKKKVSATLETWDGCRRAAFASTWDDFCIESWKKLVEQANQKQIPLTLFINTCGYCEAGHFQKHNNEVDTSTKMKPKDLKFFRKIVKEGHEIGGHTTDHIDLKKTSTIEIEKDCNLLQLKTKKF